MQPFSKCPVCGLDGLVEREVEELIRGGEHVASLKVLAEVCLGCGERLYSQDVVRHFEEVRTKLERQEISGFQPMGQLFRVA